MNNYHESVVKQALHGIRTLKGVLRAEPLGKEEKQRILDVEVHAEQNTVLGGWKSLNEGIREALNRHITVALVIESSDFERPDHPHIKVVFKGHIMGEEVSDERAAELRGSKSNIFLWKNFVLYYDQFPKSPAEKRQMKVIYQARSFEAPAEGVCDCVLGVPSMEGDAVIKRLLSIERQESTMGTCLVGFNVTKPT